MANRRSYFREAPMEEFTPANSINEEAFREEHQSRLRIWANGTGKPVLRVANAVLHLGLCTMLFAIMVEFMLWYRGHRRMPQAITLTSLVAADSCLDLFAVIRLRKRWPGWAVALRLLLAMTYIAQFLVYIGYRQVFPARYAYWGLPEGYSDPVVYIILLALGIWNLFHAALHRHALGRDLRRLVVCIQVRFVRSSQVDDGNHDNQRHTLSGHNLPTTGLPSHEVERANSPVTIALRVVQADSKNLNLVVTEQSATSSISGESSSRGGSTVHTKSPTTLEGDGTANARATADRQ
ncbi:hypothetical protein N0V93_010117 [Gnomoniopsis smithogilvyi]|uniref:Transmembrane protein n=1 Tax=Gnomoniopsis smithogilvyi TaxID=1191159 RepID=A0A9W9CS17_9PEZI|nr:hypothetical protein N0V93_010117 [Gnomoniopsis smithogilvyi]